MMTRLNNIGLKIEFTEKYKAQIFILLVMTMEKISHVYHDNLFRCFILLMNDLFSTQTLDVYSFVVKCG